MDKLRDDGIVRDGHEQWSHSSSSNIRSRQYERRNEEAFRLLDSMGRSKREMSLEEEKLGKFSYRSEIGLSITIRKCSSSQYMK